MVFKASSLAAALCLLPLGQVLLIGSNSAFASGVEKLASQGIHIQSTTAYVGIRAEKLKHAYSQDAIAANWSELIEANPRDANAYFNRGITRSSQWVANYKSAISDFSKAIEINPQFADAYYYRGNAKIMLKDFQGAIADYNKALEIGLSSRFSHFNTTAYNNRGIAKGETGDYPGACNDFKKAAALGDKKRSQWLNSEKGAWCRNMR